MKFQVEFSVDEILDSAKSYEKRQLYDALEEDFGKDVEEMVDDAFSSTKQRIFDNLLDEGYGEHLFPEEVSSLDDKRFMMDKEDEAMLDYLIEKYRYFG